MAELAANLSTLFTEWPLPERPARAAACGFRLVELRGLEGYPSAEIGRTLRDSGLGCAILNVEAGNLSAGEIGLAADPAQRTRFRDALARGMEAATHLGAPLLHVMAGRRDPGVDLTDQLANAREAYVEAAEIAREGGFGLVLEPLAPQVAAPYLFTDLTSAAVFARSVPGQGLGLLFDLFHMQLAGGDILGRFAEVCTLVRHVQVAAVPDRGEPGAGELDLGFVLEGLAERGYHGPVGCEYVPRRGTLEGLGWAAPWGIIPPGA